MRLPESKLLQGLIGWFAGGVVFHLILTAFRRDRTISDAVGNFFTDLIVPYIWGAFGSQIPLVWIGSAICAVVFALCVATRAKAAIGWARLSLSAILCFSLFTLWLEPYTSVAGVASNVAMELAKVPMKFLDVGVSIFWVVIFVRASAALEQECRPTSGATTDERRKTRRGEDRHLSNATVRGHRLTSPEGPRFLPWMIGCGVILLLVLMALALVMYMFLKA